MQKDDENIEAIVGSFAPATLLGEEYLRQQLDKLRMIDDILEEIRKSKAVAS